MLQVNFRNKELFRYKFKRDPKTWTLDEIHALWIKACERHEIRRQQIIDYTNQIVSEIPKNDKNEHIIYFYKGKDIYQYNFSYYKGWNSYGVSSNLINLKTRDEKLSFILSNDKAFEMGQKYNELVYMRTYQQNKIKNIMCDIIQDKLRKKYKDQQPPDILIMEIGDKKYFISSEMKHSYWFEFTLRNEFTGEVINEI